MKLVPDNSDYAVTEDGRVWSFAKGNRNSRGQFLLPNLDSGGYQQVILYINGKRRCMLVHHLVLETFIGPRPDGTECRHLNGDRIDNRLENLCWGTHFENMQDQIGHGTRVYVHGEKHFAAKLTEKDVHMIIYMDRTGLFLRQEIAQIYKVSGAQISDILNKKSWRHVWTV